MTTDRSELYSKFARLLRNYLDLDASAPPPRPLAYENRLAAVAGHSVPDPERASARRFTLLEVRDFRNLRAIQCDLAPITLFIGANNSGKSNLLAGISAAFPTRIPRQFASFRRDLGGTGLHSSLSHHFVSTRRSYPSGEISPGVGLLTDEAGVAVLFSDWNGHLKATWYRDGEPLASLHVNDAFNAGRFFRSQLPARVDLRRVNQDLDSESLISAAELLHEDLYGGLRVAFHSPGTADRRELDEIEDAICGHDGGNKAGVTNFIASASTLFGIPDLKFNPIHGLHSPILEAPAEKTRREETIARLRHARTALKPILKSRAMPDREVLGLLDSLIDELTPDLHRESGHLGGGLVLGDNASLAKSLGSGHLSLLSLLHKTNSSDLVLIDEPEHYLHPVLQERLASFLLDRCREVQFLVATHSPVILDRLMDSREVLVHRLGDAEIRGRSGSRGADSLKLAKILSDLGVRPSHVLQANAVVWAEGPSDCVYLSNWISLWSHGELREGRDYVCMFYGGRLASHLSVGVDDPRVVPLLGLNRNCIFVMDSDRTKLADGINETKRRLAAEVEQSGGIAWITDGREIENYLPLAVLQALGFDIEKPPGRFEAVVSFFESTTGRRQGSTDKVELAREARRHTRRDDLADVEGLSGWLDKVCARLRRWKYG